MPFAIIYYGCLGVVSEFRKRDNASPLPSCDICHTIVGLPDPGQMRSFTWNCGSGSRSAL